MASTTPVVFLDDLVSRAIYEAVCDKWTEVSRERGDAEIARNPLGVNQIYSPIFRVLASFVAINRNSPRHVRVLSIGTGTKWCYGDNREYDGGVELVDSHAEIIARRALVALLYENLKYCKKENPLFVATDPWYILEPKEMPSSAVSTLKYRLKSDLDLYLYITIPPCSEKAKVKGRFDDTNASPCSVKLSKWNVCGVQGALLSEFIEPIYLSGVVLSDGWGDPYHEINTRTQYVLGIVHEKITQNHRILNLHLDGQLREEGFRLNNPAMGRYYPQEGEFFNGNYRGQNYRRLRRSQNWYDSVEDNTRLLEVTRQNHGRLMHAVDKVVTDESRLSKQNFGIRYLKLQNIANQTINYKVLKAGCQLFNRTKVTINYPRNPPSDGNFGVRAPQRSYGSFPSAGPRNPHL